jgi:hypothetical protein
MSYRGRHRQVAHGQSRMRRTSIAAAATATALIAPIALSSPVASQAALPATALNTLANHPEWRLASSNPEVAAQITDLKQTLTERGVPFDPAKAAVYRVPTVEGFTTYVTARPETMSVRPNPLLNEHTPEGDKPADPAVVLSRLVDAETEGFTPTVTIYMLLERFDLGSLSTADLMALVDQIKDIIGTPTVGDPNEAIGDVSALLEPIGAPEHLLSRLSEIQQVVTAAVDVLLKAAGLPDSDHLVLSALVTEVVPLAVAAPPDVLGNIMANPNLPDGTREEDDGGSSASWSTRNKDCFRVQTEAFDRWVCWRIDGQDKDNDSSRNFWQLHTDVSGHSSYRRFMEKMWVEARPAPSGASNQRFDAIPQPSADYGSSEGCTTSGREFSIASGSPVQTGIGYYWERTACEFYEAKSYNDEGHWASVWWGNEWVKYDVQRAVMLKVPVKTPYDKGVSWELLTGQSTRR